MWKQRGFMLYRYLYPHTHLMPNFKLLSGTMKKLFDGIRGNFCHEYVMMEKGQSTITRCKFHWECIL
jgi:hypothetical protein